MQPGDITGAYHNIDKVHALCGYMSEVTLAEGLASLVA
ncbi:hypothetical protein EIB18_02365 [Caulobacter vibrioides]|uniref:UDP glucuronic acid epimerase-related protein n=1 Tax=Caulobacter vibrioides (strain NA1000 / CB15N) TaxID=565050 RepID=A0A0H3C6X5_CAUVN|nr:hypothetical protein [Caulobacter vibrioides]YP_002515841.1 UDP glucuronic acid epimerase-related protein [Caulobacter vibrioides NA1000]ACL93933.1 UDP glucuronic acid epimerase-related protein [Caulobacter vibrioides NA1000]AVH77055.1 hypothetical protein CA607_20220 [Caulobacter vibrioides]AZH11667.1 hypothetical protein EIB18_02365 [Caulobacter vibrioides]